MSASTFSGHTIRNLVTDLADDVRDLVRGEIALGRAEVEQKVNRIIAGVISLFGAMLLGFAGLVIVLIAAAQGLTRVTPDWAAYLVVGVVVLFIGAVMAGTARRALSPAGFVPQRVVSNVSADARVVKESAT